MNTIRKVLLTSLLLLGAVAVSYSQIGRIFKVGVKGGMDFTSITYNKPASISESMSSHTGFNAGVALSIKLPVKGMTIQPELNYVSKGSRVKGQNLADKSEGNINARMDYLEVPVNLQYGLDLILIRPFLMVSPYIGYAVLKDWNSANGEVTFGWDNLNRFEYGIGVGGGVDIWRFQVQVKYNWNLGQLITNVPTQGIIDTTTKYIMDSLGNGNFRGLDVSVTFFF